MTLLTNSSAKLCSFMLALLSGTVSSYAVAAYDPWTDPADYVVTYEIDISGLPTTEVVNLWVPLPANNHDQTLTGTNNNSPWPVSQIIDSQHNTVAEIVLPAGQRSADTITLVHHLTRAVSTGMKPGDIQANDEPGHFLQAQKKIPLLGMITDIAETEKAKLPSGADLRRGYYNYVYSTMTYSKEGEGWGQGDAIWACQSRYGNCTDFHSLFIGLARSQGIAARFKIGFPLSGTENQGRHDGYHCWAESWDALTGWIPLDASEAKKAGLRDAYYGTLPSDRIEFTQGRDIVVSPRQRGAALNYFIYPYAESASSIIEKLPVKLTWKRLNT